MGLARTHRSCLEHTWETPPLLHLHSFLPPSPWVWWLVDHHSAAADGQQPSSCCACVLDLSKCCACVSLQTSTVGEPEPSLGTSSHACWSQALVPCPVLQVCSHVCSHNFTFKMLSKAPNTPTAFWMPQIHSLPVIKCFPGRVRRSPGLFFQGNHCNTIASSAGAWLGSTDMWPTPTALPFPPSSLFCFLQHL